MESYIGVSFVLNFPLIDVFVQNKNWTAGKDILNNLLHGLLDPARGIFCGPACNCFGG